MAISPDSDRRQASQAAKRTDVRQHTLEGPDLQRARPAPAARTKKKNKKKKKNMPKIAQSRPTQSVARSGAKGFAGPVRHVVLRLSVMVTTPPAFMNCPAGWTAIKCIPALQPMPVMMNNFIQA